MKTLVSYSVPVDANANVFFEGWPQDNTERAKIIACLIGVNYCRAIQQQTERDEFELRKSFDDKEWTVIKHYAAQHLILEKGPIEPTRDEFIAVYQQWNPSSEKCAALLEFIQQHLFCALGSNTAHSKLAVYAKKVSTKEEVTSLQLNESMEKFTLIIDQIKLYTKTNQRMTLMIIAECAKAALQTQARKKVLPLAFQQSQSSSSSSTPSSSQRDQQQQKISAATPLLDRRVMPTFQAPPPSTSVTNVVSNDTGCCAIL